MGARRTQGAGLRGALGRPPPPRAGCRYPPGMASDVSLVVFDLGGVLVRIARSWSEACAAAGVPTRGAGDDDAAWRRAARAGRGLRVGPHRPRDLPRRASSRARRARYSADEVARVHAAWLLEEYPGVGALVDAIHGAGARDGHPLEHERRPLAPACCPSPPRPRSSPPSTASATRTRATCSGCASRTPRGLPPRWPRGRGTTRTASSSSTISRTTSWGRGGPAGTPSRSIPPATRRRRWWRSSSGTASDRASGGARATLTRGTAPSTAPAAPRIHARPRPPSSRRRARGRTRGGRRSARGGTSPRRRGPPARGRARPGSARAPRPPGPRGGSAARG